MSDVQEPAYVLIQEGGSSLELYVHAYHSVEEAEQGRIGCAEGAYRTSPVLEVPAELAGHGETLYSFLEDFVRLVLNIDYPSDD
jgi:hypothetical protein